MMRDFDQELARLRERWKDHELSLQAESPDGTLRSYRLRNPSMRRANSCLIVFTEEGIVIMGDWCPGNTHANDGVISCYGYGEGWFSGRLSHSYLCSKFLRKGWQPSEGYDQLKAEILRARRAWVIDREPARDAWNALSNEDRDALPGDRAYEIFRGAGLSDFEIGHDYEPNAAAMLCAIQERFAACKAAREAVAV
jgi:hypothetical protein